MDYIEEIAEIFQTDNYHNGHNVTSNNIIISGKPPASHFGETWERGYIPTCVQEVPEGMKVWFVPVDELDKTSHHTGYPSWRHEEPDEEPEEVHSVSKNTHKCKQCGKQFSIDPIEYSGCPRCRSRMVNEI